MKNQYPDHATAAFIGIAMFVSFSQSHADILVANGPVVDGSGLSLIRPGGGFFGFGAQSTVPNLVADDFVVPAGVSWNVSDISFYAYQSGAGGIFTFQDATWSIISGDVNTGVIVASGTNAVTNAGLLGYRVTSTTQSDTNRAIFEVNADVPDFTLTSGNYFLRWGLSGSLASGPWLPPTSDGAIGNALQSSAGGPFNPVVDTGDSLGVTFPFAINSTLGTISAIPEPSSLLGLGCMLSAALGFRSRRASQVIR